MKNHIFIAITTLLFVGVNNTIAMEFPQTPVPYDVNENNNSVHIIKNEFFNTYINELNEATRDFTECCAEKNNNKLMSSIEIINNNVNKILRITQHSNIIISIKELTTLKECIRNLNKEYTSDDLLIKKLYRIILNCHSILNELQCQYYKII